MNKTFDNIIRTEKGDVVVDKEKANHVIGGQWYLEVDGTIKQSSGDYFDGLHLVIATIHPFSLLTPQNIQHPPLHLRRTLPHPLHLHNLTSHSR